jgi:hypothetical protein
MTYDVSFRLEQKPHHRVVRILTVNYISDERLLRNGEIKGTGQQSIKLSKRLAR